MSKMTSISVLMVLENNDGLFTCVNWETEKIRTANYYICKLMDKADNYEIMKCSGANFKEILNSAGKLNPLMQNGSSELRQ